jgi:hypothetical protein
MALFDAAASVEWLFNVGSAARLAGVTATIILLVPHPSSVAGMMMSRIAEVGWGVTVGIATVWLVNKIQSIAAARKRSAPA